MANSLNLGYPDIPRSITNPNVNNKNAIDVGYPMSFLDFIKNINISLEPESLQNYYNFYIKTWNGLSTSSTDSDNTIIVDRYKDFLKEIILNYSTLEEKTFLTKIDFDDPLDLDIALGFYSKKLRELCDFYNTKRSNVKNAVVKTKLKGSNLGSTINIRELILSYIKNLDDSKMLFNLDDITSKLEIEIEELYDVYPLYYNQLPDEQVYDYKDLDYGLNIFLKNDQELISEVFKNTSDEIKKLKESDQLFKNKRKLTEKYMATDFFYLSTGNTIYDTISGKLFDNSNTINNFLNRNYPTTASTDKQTHTSPRAQGFFRPTNVSIVLIDGKNDSFSVNYNNLEPNSLYFYPDPLIFGDSNNIIKFTIDDSFLKRNTTSGNALNQPSSSPSDTKYFGYFSKIEPNLKKYFDNLYNSGYIKEYKQDIYGNSYALFKSGYDKHITNLDSDNVIVYNLLFNGYKYYDNLYDEELNFDYFIEDYETFNETKRTGLSSNTSNFTVFTPDITLKFGGFRNNFELIEPTDENLKISYRYLDGVILTKNNLSFISDPISSDLSAFEISNDSFYYDTLIEAGIHNDTQRALLDSSYPTLTANITDYNRLSSTIVDGGSFYDNVSYFTSTKNSIYIDSNINSTELLPVSTFDHLNGSLFIKNSKTKQIYNIFETLYYLPLKYPSNIITELNNITKFEVIYDTLSIETPSYILFEKIVYNDGSFSNSNLPTQYTTHNLDNFSKITNRVKVGNNVYYAIMESESLSGQLKVFPNIYNYDLIKNVISKIYPLPSTDITDYFDVSVSDVIYNKLQTPIISYSSRNNIFTISFILKDQNDYPMITSYDYMLCPNVEFIQNNHIILTNEIISNNFSSITSNIVSYLDNTYTLENESIII